MNVECPICGWKGREFLPAGGEYRLFPRRNAICPECGAAERHRLLFLYLKENISQDKRLKVLHFAPEK